MRFPGTLLWLTAAFVLASCAGLAPREPSGTEGLVVGTITYDSSLGEYRVGLLSVDAEHPSLIRVGHSLWHPFVRMYDDDLKMRGAPFSVRLPAGDYRIAYWEVSQGQARSNSTAPIELPLRVEAGKATYLGNVHFSAHWEVSLNDEAGRDLPILKARFPEIEPLAILPAIEPGTKHERLGGAYDGALFPGPGPWHRFRLDGLHVHMPVTGGWTVLRLPGQWAFGRRGESPDESQVARVAVVPWDGPGDPESLLETVRASVAADSNPERFEVLESSLEPVRDRGYPCVRHRTTALDRPSISAEETRPLRLETLSLFCVLPEGKVAFSALYSTRARAGDASFEAAAESFLRGVHLAK